MKQHHTAASARTRNTLNNRIAKWVMAGTTLLCASSAMAADLYVDGLNGSNNNTGTLAAPFKEVWRAWQLAQPGDTIHLLPTVVYGPQYFGGGKSGLQGSRITIQGDGVAPNLTQVSGMGKNFGIYLAKGTNYINIKNLDVTAPGNSGYAPWSAIFLAQNHHVDIVGNYTHDAGCSGIQTTSSDYVNIMLNRSANNAKDTTGNIFCSGISTHENLDSDTQTGYKIWVQNNIVYGNINVASANCVAPCRNSDGNGIIVDDNRRTQTDNVAYKGKMIVQNNVIFNNGGRGIAVFYSNNVDIMGNTLFQNNQDPAEGAWQPGEVGISYSGGINVYNNVLYTDGLWAGSATGNRVAVSVQDNTASGWVNVDYNLLYAAQNNLKGKSYTRNNTIPVTIGANNKWGDPLFKAASINPAIAQFQVLGTSPALGFATPAGMFPGSDYNWAPRGTLPTAGAYQKSVN